MRPPGEVLLSAEWEVRSIARHAEAAQLCRAWHYSRGAPNTSTYRHGLYRAGVLLHGEAFGVALWIPPTRAAAETVSDEWGGVLSLSRLAIDPALPTNAASFLLGRSMRAIDRKRWPVLVTYADTARGHTGAIYLATNWDCLGEVAAGDTWTSAGGEQRGRRRGGRTFTVAEMVERGYTRNAHRPKIKFVHRAG